MTGAAGSAVGRLWPASMHLCRAGCHRLLDALGSRKRWLAQRTGGGLGGEAVNEKEFAVMLDTITPRENVRDLSEEEKEEARRRYRKYSRRLMEREHAWRQDLQTKIALKRDALAALPEELQAAAMEPDLEPFPLDRWIATLSPPRLAKDKGAEKAKEAVGTKSGLGMGKKQR